MNALRLVTSVALTLAALPAAAQTEAEEEQRVFVEILGEGTQVPSTLAALICGLPAEQIEAEFVGGTDPACVVDEGAASGMGLLDEAGEIVDLSPQGLANVQLPDNATPVPLPLGIAARLCGVEEGDLREQSASVRTVACEVPPESLEASPFPSLRLEPGAGADTEGDADQSGRLDAGGAADELR